MILDTIVHRRINGSKNELENNESKWKITRAEVKKSESKLENKWSEMKKRACGSEKKWKQVRDWVSWGEKSYTRGLKAVETVSRTSEPGRKIARAELEGGKSKLENKWAEVESS